MAVLYRENFQSRVLEEACLAFDVPYRVIGVRFFERKEVKDALSYLRAAKNPKSATDLSRIIGTPSRGIGKVTVQKCWPRSRRKDVRAWRDVSFKEFAPALRGKLESFADLMKHIAHAIETLPASDAVRYTLEASGLESMFKEDSVEGPEHLENIRELVNLATRYDDPPGGGLPPEGIERLLEDAALQSDQDEIPAGVGSSGGVRERGAVSLMTAHASKGLEFDAVFVSGLEQGLFPSLREGEGDRDPEEERRLFYVALTRARKNLFLTFSAARLRYGTREYTIPSEFLEDIDPRLMTLVSRERSGTAHAGLID
jgi:DNA helicase-2/ATP-dependent DNA helicase PcrA